MAFDDMKTGERARGAKLAGLGIAAAIAFTVVGAPGVALAEGDVADIASVATTDTKGDIDELALVPADQEQVVAIANDDDAQSVQVATDETVLNGDDANKIQQEAQAEPSGGESDPEDELEETTAGDAQDAIEEASDSTDGETTDTPEGGDDSAVEDVAQGESIELSAAKVMSLKVSTTAGTLTAATTPSTTTTSTTTNTTVATVPSEAKTLENPVNVYRMYNPNSGEHFYTASLSEATYLFGVGWRWESTAYQASSSTGKAVYRLYNPNAGNHFYTTNQGESNYLRTVGWRYENIAWYAFGDANLYRLYNPNSTSGEHLYTTSTSERDSVIKAGWNYEGVAWLVTPGFRTIAGQWVVSSAYGSQERYWVASNTQIAKNRYITPSEGTGYSVNAYATSSGAVVRNRTHVGSGVMFADNEGRLKSVPSQTGWWVTSSLDGHLERYYITTVGHASNGAALMGARTGWFAVSGANYYGFYTLGYVARNTVVGKDNNNVYEADNDGKLTKINNYKSTAWKYANNVGSSTSWFLANSLNNYRTLVFRKFSANDPWAMVEDFLCGYGENTFMGRYRILGRFMTKDNGYQYTLYNTYYAYAPREAYSTRWQMYHGSLYYTKNKALAETGLGQQVSGGCIRLSDANAKYIYENVPDGTTMYTYK